MRKLILSTLMSLNGSVTDQQQWSSGYFDDEAKAHATAMLDEADLFLLGRRTYDAFAPRWPQIKGDRYFDAINAKAKLVFSNTLTEVGWNARLVTRDPVAEVRALRAGSGRAILTYGLTTLSRALLAAGLVDELHLSIYPVIADGARAFEGLAGDAARLALADVHRYKSGVVQLTLVPQRG